PTASAEEAMPVATGGGRLKLLTPVKPSCDTVAASVGLTPGATLTMRRNAVGVPTETVLAWSAIEPRPKATAFCAVACAFWPSAVACCWIAAAFAPTAVPDKLALAAWPSAVPFTVANAFWPTAVALAAFASALLPTAVALVWPAAVAPAWALLPSAVVPVLRLL